MENELQQGRITVESIETKAFETSTQYTIKSGGKTYKFYDTKKDGNPTKAMMTFEGTKRGTTVDILFKEEQKDYQGKPYTARTIVSFGDKDMPVIQTSPVSDTTSDQKYNDAMSFIDERFLLVLERLSSIEKAINKEEKPVAGEDLSDTGVPF